MLFEEKTILLTLFLDKKGLFSEEAYKTGIMCALKYVRIRYQINRYSYLKRTHFQVPLILSHEEGHLRKVLGLWKILLFSKTVATRVSVKSVWRQDPH